MISYTEISSEYNWLRNSKVLKKYTNICCPKNKLCTLREVDIYKILEVLLVWNVEEIPENFLDVFAFHSDMSEEILKFISEKIGYICRPNLGIKLVSFFTEIKNEETFNQNVASRGYFDFLKWGIQKNFTLTIEAFVSSCKSENLELVKWLYKFFEIEYSSMKKIEDDNIFLPVYSACSSGSLKVLKFLISERFPLSPRCFHEAFFREKGSKIKFFQLLIDNSCDANSETINFVISLDDVDLFYDFLERYSSVEFEYHTLIIKYGNVEILEYLLNSNRIGGNSLIESAVEYQRMDILKFLFKRNLPYCKETLLESCKNSQMFDYLIDKMKCKCSPEIMNKSFQYGISLKCLIRRGFVLHEELFRESIRNNDIDMCKSLIEKKCPAPEDIVEFAICEQHIEIIKLLIKNNFPISYDCYDYCCDFKDVTVLNLLKNKGAPYSHRLAISCMKTDNLIAFQWFYKNDMISNYTFLAYQFIEFNAFEILKWIHRFLRSQKLEILWNVEDILEACITYGRTNISEWISKEMTK